MKYDDNGLIPAIIQDDRTGKVLMLGYMNQEAFSKTTESKLVTFFSRSKQRLWTKGESSKNYLRLVSWSLDCDQDALLFKVNPDGPTCHTGSDTCWEEENQLNKLSFIDQLESVIDERQLNRTEKSYTSSLFDKGTHKIAQKVGEEAVELVIESMMENDALFLGEAADLLYHYLILLRDRNMKLEDVVRVLQDRS